VARTVVLVEGASDAAALVALAARLGRSLETVDLVAMGGVTNLGRYLERHRGDRVAGLYDAGEERFVLRALERAGLLRGSPEAAGFFACVPDLEGELIRALGVTGVERVIAAAGELASLRILRRQPAQRDRTPEEQLHRFMGTRSQRKARYAHLLAEALDPSSVPRPLAGLLAVVAPDGATGAGPGARRGSGP
jgi:hypothetical protein